MKKIFTIIFVITLIFNHSVFAQNTTQKRKSKPPAVAPTHVNVKYGPHERNVMDIWLAKSDNPSPVLVSIHGGGFRHGNKSVSNVILKECLKSGISVVTITYRFSDQAIAPAQFHDAARAIQFIRHHSKEWNIDPTRIAATGGSAGACLSLWLGFHDDLADANNEDPVLRESTRLTCMAVVNGQSSLDPRFIKKLFPKSDTYQTSALAELVDADLKNLDNLPADKYKLFEEISPINHLTKDDAPVLMTFNSKMETPVTSRSIGIHHPKFGKVLQEKMAKFRIECQLETGVPRKGPTRSMLIMAFVRKHLSEKPIIENNITYGKSGDVELKLDLARPHGQGPFPGIVFIHGGGWAFGHRIAYKKRIEGAARRGYVAITASYRLMKFDKKNKETTSATQIFPSQVHDVKAAVRWLRANAAKYHVDPDHIGVNGGSAGGHLSLMVGLTDPSAKLEGESGHGEQSSRVQAVVNEFGPTEMVECFHKSTVSWCFRLLNAGTPDEAPENYKASSPITYVSKDDPPVLTLQGDTDKLVPVTQATLLDEKMKAAGAPHTLMILKGQGHGFRGVQRYQAEKAMWAFFDKHLKI